MFESKRAHVAPETSQELKSPVFKFSKQESIQDLGDGRFRQRVTDCNGSEHRIYDEVVQHAKIGNSMEILNAKLIESAPCDCIGGNKDLWH